jgi:hypothetical protein
MELLKKISNHPITGQRRAIRLKQIAYIDFDIKEARIYWEEMVLDAGDKPIKSNLIPTRVITSILSNSNKVTNTGITITKEYIESINPIIVEDLTVVPQIMAETEEEYSTRIQSLLELALETGNLEFNFYVSQILSLTKIGQAVVLLDSMQRFDRE